MTHVGARVRVAPPRAAGSLESPAIYDRLRSRSSRDRATGGASTREPWCPSPVDGIESRLEWSNLVLRQRAARSATSGSAHTAESHRVRGDTAAHARNA